MTAEVSETGHRYQLILRGECGPLTGWLFGDVTIETGNGCTSLTFSARDDSELHGLLDRIQDLALHLISLYEIGGTEAVPDPPVRASLAHPGASPYTTAGPHTPPWGPAVLPRTAPGRHARNAKASGRVAQPPSGRSCSPLTLPTVIIELHRPVWPARSRDLSFRTAAIRAGKRPEVLVIRL